jgi:hypothetical protein
MMMVVDDSGDDGDDNCGNGNEDGMTMVIRALITCQALSQCFTHSQMFNSYCNSMG